MSGVTAAAELDIDLTTHRATPLTSDVIASADLVLCMEEEHIAAVLALDSGATVELLSPNDAPIPDPYGRDHVAYATSYRLILDALRTRLAGRV